MVGTEDGGLVLSCYGEGYYLLMKLDVEGDVAWEKYNLSREIYDSGDGGFLLWSWGSPSSYPAGSGELAKYDRDGNEIWAGDHGAPHLVPSGDGGYVGAMEMEGDVYVVKIDEKGEVLWEEIYGDRVSASSLVKAADGGFFLTGYAHSRGSLSDIYLMKVDDEGDLLWEGSYGGDGWDSANHAAATVDGGVLLAGQTRSSNQNSEIYLVKLDSDGDLMWEGSYGGDGWDYAEYVIQTRDGGYLVVGSSIIDDPDEDGNYCDVYLLRIDGSGDPVWEGIHGYGDYDYASSVVQIDDGGFLVIGQTRERDEDTDAYLLRVGGSGHLVWQRTSGGEEYDTATRLIEDEEGILIVGLTRSHGDGHRPYALRIDESGNEIWYEIYGNLSLMDFGMSYYRIGDIVEHHDEGIVAGGGVGSWENFLYLLRINATGIKVWETHFDGRRGQIDSITTTTDGFVIAWDKNWVPEEPSTLSLMKLREVVPEGFLLPFAYLALMLGLGLARRPWELSTSWVRDP
jgi:hypothetical protein